MPEWLKIIGIILLIIGYFWFQRKYGWMSGNGSACRLPQSSKSEVKQVTPDDSKPVGKAENTDQPSSSQKDSLK